MAWPMPELPPVTMATFPSIPCMVSSPGRCVAGCGDSVREGRPAVTHEPAGAAAAPRLPSPLVLAYKFLDRDGGTALSGYRWVLPTGDEPGAWLEVAEVRPCRSGIHACRAGDLAYWLHQELWQVELDGDLTEADRKVVARRGRLVRRVGGWSGGANVELFAWCAWRVRDLAVGALRAESHAGWASSWRRPPRCVTWPRPGDAPFESWVRPAGPPPWPGTPATPPPCRGLST